MDKQMNDLAKTTLIFFSLSFILILPVVNSTSVEIDIAKDLKGEINSFIPNTTTNLAVFESEFYNIGSIPYNARMRVDIYDESNLIFTGWGYEEDFIPGHRRIYRIYWYSNTTGEFTATVRAYYANEIISKNLTIEKPIALPSESIFEVKDLRTYENYVVFDLSASKDAENLVIIPNMFPPGWIFEQKTIDSLEKDETKTILLNYNPTVWTPTEVKLSIVSDEGKYFSEQEFELERESGILGAINHLIDTIKMFFQK